VSAQRGVVLLTIPPEAADRFDFLANRYALTQEQVVVAAVAVLSSMVEARDERALRFMQAVHDDAHRSLDAQLTTIHRGG
jgi:hypothetical protein